MADRPTLILLPAMPCGPEFYEIYVGALTDLADCRVMVEDAPSLVESADRILAAAPPRFLLAGTAYGIPLALKVALAAPERIAGLWLMNCSPGAHANPADATRLTARVRAEGTRRCSRNGRRPSSRKEMTPRASASAGWPAHRVRISSCASTMPWSAASIAGVS